MLVVGQQVRQRALFALGLRVLRSVRVYDTKGPELASEMKCEGVIFFFFFLHSDPHCVQREETVMHGEAETA